MAPPPPPSSKPFRAVRLLPRGGSAIAMGLTTLVAFGAVIYSHDSQVQERKVMRAGVERDKERLRLKKKRNQQQQQAEEKQEA